MANSIRSNFVFNLINVISSLLFPLITFPYASRILMADGIGQVQFLNSIISYVTIFSSIGIPMYAIKEIAKVRDDSYEMGKTALEVLTLHGVLTVIGYLVVFAMCFFVGEIRHDVSLFLILSLSMFFSMIGCSWFYSGIEDFKYITVLGLVMRVLSLAFLFVFVKEKADLYYYAIYVVLIAAGSGIINFIHLRKYIKIRMYRFSDLRPLRHLRPALHVFALNLITSIYLNLDSVMLGFLATSVAVGYYTAATRLSHILLSIVTSLGTVLLPRLSNLANNNQFDEFRRLSQKSCDFVFFLGLPIVCGLILTAGPLIHVFCGSNYDPAILTLQILAPIVLIIGLSNYVGIQILYPQNQINMVLLCTGIGALVNFLLNLILIPSFQQTGAAVATLAAELSVTISLLIVARKYIPFQVLSRNSLKCAVACAFMLLACYPFSFLQLGEFQMFALMVLTGVIVYCALLIAMKESFVWESICVIKRLMHERV